MLMLKRWAAGLGMKLLLWAMVKPQDLTDGELAREVDDMSAAFHALRTPYLDELDSRLNAQVDQRLCCTWPSDNARMGAGHE